MKLIPWKGSFAVMATLFTLLLLTMQMADARMTEFPVEERPEGITNGPGSTLFASQILSGKVLAIDALTGDTVQVVGAQLDREAWGLWYHNHKEEGYLFVAGGGPSYGNGIPEVYLYNVSSGKSLAACSLPVVNETGNGAFVNDVAVLGGMAYVTNSFSPKLMAVHVACAINGVCLVEELVLPNNFIPADPNDWSVNGVVPYGSDGILICHEIDGSVWYISNLTNGVENPIFQEVIPDGGVPGADGLTISDDKLYVTQNYVNTIGVFQLSMDDNNLLVATLLGNLTSPEFETPATSAVYDGYVYSTISRFVTLPDIATPANNNVIGVKDTTYNGNAIDHDYVTLDAAAGGCIGRKQDGSDELYLKDCSSNDDSIQWRWDGKGRFRSKLDDTRCMQVGQWPAIQSGVKEALNNGTPLYVKDCGEGLKKDFQVFDQSFEKVGGLSGPLFLQSRPDLCVVHFGAEPVIGESRIMMKDCDSLGGDRSLGWEADNPCTHSPGC